MSKQLTLGFPVEFNSGRPSAKFEAKFIELAKTIADIDLVLTWDDMAASRKVSDDSTVTRSEACYTAFLVEVFGIPTELAAREARRLEERGEKVALYQSFRALITRRYPMPVGKVYSKVGLVINDVATSRTIHDPEYENGLLTLENMVDTFGFEEPEVSYDSLPPGVNIHNAKKALLAVAAGAEVIITDSTAIEAWLNNCGVTTVLCPTDWMALDFSHCGASELEALISLVSPINEIHGVKFNFTRPILRFGDKDREVRPMISWTANTVRVHESGWEQLCAAACYAIETTFDGTTKRQEQRFSGRIGLFPIWDDTDVYVPEDPSRQAVVKTAAKIVKQSLTHEGDLVMVNAPGFNTEVVLPLVRRYTHPVTKVVYDNAIGHDQGACIYLHGESIGVRKVTAEEAVFLTALGLTTRGGGRICAGTVALATDKVNKMRKRHTLFRSLSFEPTNKTASKLVVGGEVMEGVLIPVALCPTAISAQAGDGIIVNLPEWQKAMDHLAYHTYKDVSSVELTAEVAVGRFVEKGDTLFKGDTSRVRSGHRGRVVYIDVRPEGTGHAWEAVIVENRRGGDAKTRAMGIKCSAHPYPEGMNPWDNDRNAARGLMTMGMVIGQDPFKGEVAYASLQILCDTFGIDINYDAVDHALGKYDYIYDMLESIKHRVTLRWVMTPDEAGIWEDKGVLLDVAPVSDGANGTFELVLEEDANGEVWPVLYQETWGYIGKVVVKIEASGVEDAVGKGRLPLEVSYWLDSVGCPQAAYSNFERGEEAFELLRKLHAMNLGVINDTTMNFDFGTDAGIAKVTEILAEGAEKGDSFSRFADAVGTHSIKLIAKYDECVLDLETLESFSSRDAHGHYVGMAETALALLGLIANPDSNTTALLIYKFKKQLEKLVKAPGTNKLAHRGAPCTNAKIRGYKFIPYGECWITEGGPVHKALTESMGLSWKKELARQDPMEFKSDWILDDQMGYVNRMPIPVSMVVRYRVVPAVMGVSPHTFNLNAVQISVTHGDLDGDGGAGVVETDTEAAEELARGPIVNGEPMAWFEYQSRICCELVTGKPLYEATFGEHQTPEAKKGNLRAKPVFVEPETLEAAMVGSIKHQIMGIGRKFNHAFVALTRASNNPAMSGYATWAYLAGYEVTLGGYDPADQNLIDAMNNVIPATLHQALVNCGQKTEYLNEIAVTDKLVRSGTTVAKWGNLPKNVNLSVAERNAMWLSWGIRQMAQGILFSAKDLVWDEEMGEEVLGFGEGHKFLATFMGTDFYQDLMEVDVTNEGVSVRAFHRYLTQLVPVLAGYVDLQ